MTTVVLGEHDGLQAWLDQRRALGQDGHDEVWEGVYHVSPVEHLRNGVIALRIHAALADRAAAADLYATGPFNLGSKTDYRVPDGGWVEADAPMQLYVPTAVAVLEVLSPDDETYAKLGFYDRLGVREVLVADPAFHTLVCWSRKDAGSVDPPAAEASWAGVRQRRSRVFDVDIDGSLIAWP